VSEALRLYFDFCVFMLGAVVGSFLNVCIHRMPRGESIVNPPSHCPHCNERIRWYHNIPLFAWLWLGGKCRYCGAKITARYFLVELLTATLFLAIWLRYELTWVAPVYWVLVGGLIAATFIDLEHYIIPDEITVFGVLVGFSASCIIPELHREQLALLGGYHSFMGILIGSGLVLWIAIFGELAFRKEAMGFGDVKLLGLIGAFCGWEGSVFALMAGSAIGAVAGLLWIKLSPARQAARQALTAEQTYHSLDAWSMRDEADAHAMGSSIPFGPFLALAALLWLFVGDEVHQWWTSRLLGNL
jgi:leader peptidase (prepilin peptidase)/N-methyltransferase